MNKRMARLLEYEKRLIEDRQHLQRLMEESQLEDTELIKSKLEYFQQEIQYMYRQSEYLKADLERNGKWVEEGLKKEETKAWQHQPMPEQFVQKTEVSPAQPVQKSEFSPTQKRDLEKTIGKSFMGIVASGLIFISLILFATLLLPYFNDTAKMITTYLISFAFTGVGLFQLKKDKTNKFFVAITGCGIGAIYISLLLSNMYFKVIGDILLYVFICIWGIGVCFLAKLQNKVFQIIGELGILISVIFGCLLCNATDDGMKFAALLIFYVISTILFYVVHYKEEFFGNLLHHSFHIINCILLICTAGNIVEDGFQLQTCLILLLLLLSVFSVLHHKLEKSNISFGIVISIYAYQIYAILERILENEFTFGITVYLMCLAFIPIMEWKKANAKAGKNISYITGILLGTMGLESCGVLYEYGMVPMLILPLFILGFYRKNVVYKYAGLVLLTLYTFAYSPIGDIAHFLLEGVAIVILFLLIYKCKEQYSRALKYSSHLLTLLFLSTCMGDMVYELFQWQPIATTITYMVCTIFNIAMLKSCFGSNLLTKEKENPALYNIVNIVIMIAGILLIERSFDGICHFLIIITTVAAFMVNAKNILEQRNNMFGGIYVGLKFTLLIVIILKSFDSVNYVISIACFVLAIVSIVIGFAQRYKSLRIFGLILSMISTFKLIMIDINYDNTLGNAVSFFVSGMLCFVISLIYNYIDRRVNQDRG